VADSEVTVKAVSWLSTRDAAVYLGFPSVAAFHKWLQEERKQSPCRVKVYWLRGRMRFARTNLDSLLELEPVMAVAQNLTLVRGRR
jgi:hypothetical protein